MVCLTMLHYIPTVAEQYQAFPEVARVLRPGGTFACTDSIEIGWLFHAIHVGDTLNPVNSDDLPAAPRARRAHTWTKWGAATGRFGGRRESLNTGLRRWRCVFVTSRTPEWGRPGR